MRYPKALRQFRCAPWMKPSMLHCARRERSEPPMTQLTLEEVEHIAELAKLALTEEEKARFRDQLSAILDYAARLQSLDTSAIPPTASVLPVDTILRDDVARPAMPRDQLLSNTEHQEDGMFRVDVVLED